MIELFLSSGEAATGLFLKVLNMSISALWLVAVVMLLRFALKRAPKWVNVLLWAFVALRLVCPFTIESALSLIPSTQTVSPEIMLSPSPTVDTGIEVVNDVVNPMIQSSFTPNLMSSANPLQILIPVSASFWLLGMAVMVLYTWITYLVLRRRMATAVRLKGNIYRSEAAASPFVLGLFRPRIYLPFSMEEQDIPHVIAHEQAHIRRKDHWWKPIGFLVLTIHWFNPVVWLSYILLCRDIELACDEKVIKEMGRAQQADYSQALLNCSIHRRSIAACPLAFGEVGVKKRVANILNYKKPAFWVILAAVVVCIIVAVCFLTDPVDEDMAPFWQDWYIDSFLYLDISHAAPDLDVDWNYHLTTESFNTMLYAHYRLSEDGEFSVIEAPDNGTWATLGSFEEAHLSMLNFDEYFKPDGHWYTGLYRPEKFRETCVNAWRLNVNPEGHPGLFYLLLEMEDGKFYLMYGYDENTSNAAQEEASAMYWAARLTGVDPAAATAIRWFDYLETGTYPDPNADFQATTPDFPGVLFRADPNAVYAEVDGVSTEIITGMPVWNLYLCDLTGDGIDELCATISFGSGIIDEHVVVFDYATGTEYTLWDRGVFDYTLRLEDGRLVCDRWFYPHNGLSASGQLMLVSAGGGYGMRLEIKVDEAKNEMPSVSFSDFDFSSVTDIKLTNAHNGISTAISQPDAVEAICAWMSGVSGTNGRNSKGYHYQGTYALALMAGDETLLSIAFGDDEVFFYGDYDKNYRMMYDLEWYDIDGVIHYLSHFDESGFDWGFEETMVTVEVSPYEIIRDIPEEELEADIEYLQPGDIIGYGFLKEELRELAILLNNLMPEAFEEALEFTPTMKVNLRWPGGTMTLYSDGEQTVFGEDGQWAVRTQDLNKFFARFNPGRLMGEEIVPLEDLNPNYNSEQAMIDGCVVMYDQDIRDNAELFADFVGTVSRGVPNAVRVAEFSSEERFAVRVYDIAYDGGGFTWQAIENGQFYERRYQYLYHFAGEAETANASYDAYEAYILTDNRNATWEQLWDSLYSSQAGATTDFTLVYMDYIYYPDHPAIPDCKEITLEFEGEVLLSATDMDAIENLFAQAEETYKPKTWSLGPILRLTGKDGTEVVIELSLDTDWGRIDGIYYDFGPGYDEDGSYNALPELFALLGISEWPEAVRRAYPDFF